RLAPQGVFLDDFSYAVINIDEHVNAHQIKEDEEAFYITTATVVCRVTKKDFLVSFEDKQGKVFNADYAPMHWEENPDFGGYYVYCTKKADRKSTRLNSSHVKNSYAVFCLKKKNFVFISI